MARRNEYFAFVNVMRDVFTCKPNFLQHQIRHFPICGVYRRRSSLFCRMDLSCFFVSGSFPEICQFSSLSFSNSILRSPSSSMPPWSSPPSLRHSVGAIRNAGIGLQYFPERVLVSGVGRGREGEGRRNGERERRQGNKRNGWAPRSFSLPSHGAAT